MKWRGAILRPHYRTTAITVITCHCHNHPTLYITSMHWLCQCIIAIFSCENSLDIGATGRSLSPLSHRHCHHQYSCVELVIHIIISYKLFSQPLSHCHCHHHPTLSNVSIFITSMHSHCQCILAIQSPLFSVVKIVWTYHKFYTRIPGRCCFN